MDCLRFNSFIRTFVAASLAALTLIIALNWWIDPLQFYRKATYPPCLIDQKRFQNPGLARSYDYDAVIIGTSLSENFEPEYIHEKLGLHALNLSMKGASAYEQRLTIDLAKRTGKARNVLWEINYEYLRGDTTWVSNYDGNFPYYFYDHNPLNKINNYLLNADTTKLSFKVLLSKCGMKTYESRSMQDVYTWHKHTAFGKTAALSNYERILGRRDVLRIQVPEYAAANLNANFDANVMEVIKQHPETTFRLYFPPYSILRYALINSVSPEIFKSMLENRDYAYRQTRNLPNVQLFDFQPLSEIVLNLDNYCDPGHFTVRINEFMIDSMAAKRHLMDASNNERLRKIVQGALSSNAMFIN